MTSTTTIRINTSTHATLRKLAQEQGSNLTETLDRLLREEETRRFFVRMEEAHQRVMADPEAQASRQEELQAWDVTAGDGLKELNDDLSEAW